MFPQRYIHKFTWTTPDGKTHDQIDHILIERRWHSSILDVQSFRGADFDTDHYLVVAKVRERLAVNKPVAPKFDAEDSSGRSMSWRLGNIIRLRFETCLQCWRTYVVART